MAPAHEWRWRNSKAFLNRHGRLARVPQAHQPREVLIVPCTFFSLTLEPKQLIDDALAELRPLHHPDDELSETRPSPTLAPCSEPKDGVYVRFGHPLDVVGNPLIKTGTRWINMVLS